MSVEMGGDAGSTRQLSLWCHFGKQAIVNQPAERRNAESSTILGLMASLRLWLIHLCLLRFY